MIFKDKLQGATSSHWQSSLSNNSHKAKFWTLLSRDFAKTPLSNFSSSKSSIIYFNKVFKQLIRTGKCSIGAILCRYKIKPRNKQILFSNLNTGLAIWLSALWIWASSFNQTICSTNNSRRIKAITRQEIMGTIDNFITLNPKL